MQRALKLISKNAANLIVFVRISMLAPILLLLSSDSQKNEISGAILLLLTFTLDGIDGYAARKLNINSEVGALLDTLGDRITENVMVVYFSYQGFIPLWIAIFFIMRSFSADFIRTLNFKKNIGTFGINDSWLGKLFVSSIMSRVLYLAAKMLLFAGCSLILILKSGQTDIHFQYALRKIVYFNCFAVFIFNFIRFIILIYDSRHILRDEFFED